MTLHRSYVPGETEGQRLAPHRWPRAEIEGLADELLEGSAESGRRTSALVNSDLGPNGGVSPGVDVSINVLRPGERTVPHRHTSSVVSHVARGHGHSVIGGQRVEWGPGDVFTTPGWLPHVHVAADDSEPVMRVAFSDAPLLRRLGILLHEGGDPEERLESPPTQDWDPELGARVAGTDVRILGYDDLLKPAWRPLAAQRWGWDAIKGALDPMDNGDPEYHGRRVIMLYDPVTGPSQGTVGRLLMFAGIIAASEIHPPHRHTSVAVNYWTAGRGFSIVEGKRYDWEAGDLVISPAWSAHGHANDGDDTAWGVVVHDTPLLYELGVLLWQEVLDGSIARLGADHVDQPVGSA
jgi:gentisate 1,2-dioxygenase